ncbi:MAG: DUF2141 domain-containing protein [Flavobacteriales bacterium]|nr:DUF2141 domain-containing protein [Flavobacteriales bacterium]
MSLNLYLTLLLSCCFIANTPHTKTEQVTVRVRINNIHNIESNLMIAVFSHYNDFLTERMYKQKMIEVTDFTQTLVEFQVEKGEYAIAAFQDINKNGDLDRNMFQYPTEPFGFSNNFRPMFRAPHWTDVAFQAGEDELIEIDLK